MKSEHESYFFVATEVDLVSNDCLRGEWNASEKMFSAAMFNVFDSDLELAK